MTWEAIKLRCNAPVAGVKRLPRAGGASDAFDNAHAGAGLSLSRVFLRRGGLVAGDDAQHGRAVLLELALPNAFDGYQLIGRLVAIRFRTTSWKMT
jgi:hypothetical protein